MQREFSINIIFLILVNLLIKPFYIFGIDRCVQNVVGTHSYGMYFELLSLAYLFQIINDLGIQNFNSREISMHPHLLQKYFPNILSLKLVLGLLYMTVVFLVAYLSGYALPDFHLLFFIALAQVLVSLIFYLRSNIAALGFYRYDSFISVLDKLLMILICGALLWIPYFRRDFQISWFVYAQVASLVLTAVSAFLMVRRRLVWATLRFHRVLLWVILKRSYPFALVVLLMTIYTRIDAVMLGRMLADGAYQTGVYGAAYRLLDATNMIGFLFATLLLPMFSKLLKEKKSAGRLARQSFQLIWAGSVALSVSVFFFRTEIMHLLYTHATDFFGAVMGWLILSFIAVAGTYIYGTLLTANGNLMKMNRIFLVSIILNIVLNLILIPRMKAEGAAIATLVTQWAVFLAQVRLAQRELRLPTNFRLLIRLAFYLAWCSGIAFYLSGIASQTWVYHFVLALAISALGALLSGLLNFKMLFKIIAPK